MENFILIFGKIEKERFEASEVLFNPGYAGFEMRGCHELVFDCINVIIEISIIKILLFVELPS